jgi:hypothetical protein
MISGDYYLRNNSFREGLVKESGNESLFWGYAKHAFSHFLIISNK